MRNRERTVPVAVVFVAAALFGASGAGAEGLKSGREDQPDFAAAKIIRTHYDGIGNDLLTAGLGKTGLGSTTAPPVAIPLSPTAEELRRLAIYNNYRALVDPTPSGGYGVLYGPNVTAEGVVTSNEGLIAGDEYITFANGLPGEQNVTMMVQVPDSYDLAHGCIVAAPSSGSRGVYGAIATAGEWGLTHGCAVAYTDKGTGTGAHDLQNNTVNLIQGQRQDAFRADDDSNFTADLTAAELAAFNAATPNRFAFKHAHDQQNPEKNWGRDVLRSIEFAFFVLNEKFSARPDDREARRSDGENGGGDRENRRAVTKENTVVIASSISNGGGASVRAVEQDRQRLIDGVAVGEPNVNPAFDGRFSIVQEGRPALRAHSRPLIDYITLVNVFQGCANLAPANATAPLNLAASAGRCASLHGSGLLLSTALTDQAMEAQKIINDFGILPEQNVVQPGYWFAFVPQSISMTYANAYGRFGVADALCGYSLGATVGGAPTPLPRGGEAIIFGTSNGIPPTSGVNLINDLAPGGAKEDRVSTPDQDLGGALCLRSLATGKEAASDRPLSGTALQDAGRIAEGVGEILASGNLHGIPAVFVSGRNDGILPLNFASRAYFGLNNLVEGRRSQLHYYEVTNAHHLDAFNSIAGYNTLFIPLHHYYRQAMDLMWDHLRHGDALPPSQVVHTTPRGPGAPPITLANVPPIAAAPPPSALITFTSGEVRIPN
jgi:hydroxybutyrate-dimer hydrolase